MTRKQKTALAVLLIVVTAVAAIGYVITINSNSYQVGRVLGTWATEGAEGSRELELALYKNELGKAIWRGEFYDVHWTIKKDQLDMEILSDSGVVLYEVEGLYKNGVLTIGLDGRTLTLTEL